MEPNLGQNEIHTSTETHESGAGGGFPPFNTDTFADQILWLAITFGCLFYAMNKFVIPRISGIIKARHDILQTDLAEAAELKNQASEAAHAYDKTLKEANEKASSLAQKIYEETHEHNQLERKKLEAKLEEKLKAAEQRIGEAHNKALGNINVIAASVAEDIIEKLTGNPPKKEYIQNAVKSLSL